MWATTAPTGNAEALNPEILNPWSNKAENRSALRVAANTDRPSARRRRAKRVAVNPRPSRIMGDSGMGGEDESVLHLTDDAIGFGDSEVDDTGGALRGIGNGVDAELIGIAGRSEMGYIAI